MFNVTGKNVVYVGSFTGVGYQVVRQLVKKNIKNLVFCGRMENHEALKVLQAENSNVHVTFVHVNVLDRVSIQHAIQEIVGMIKHIDVLVNACEVLADKDVETTIGVNLTGLINTTLVALPWMDKTQLGQGGIVLNISSVFGLEPAPGFAVYSAAKHGVIGFTRSMANDHIYQKTGVAFIAVCPGLTQTEIMMNLRENVTLHQHCENFVDTILNAKHQSPEEAAVNVVKALELFKNGGIYIANLGQLKEVLPTCYWQI